MTSRADRLRPSLATLKDRIAQRVDALADQLLEASHAIHADPELGFEEHRTAERLVSLLGADARFTVETGIAGLATAFRASLVGRQPGPTVAILAEYDALPRVGHACGHNIICTSAVGAGLALATIVDQLAGTIQVVGTPAEEGGGGKILMLQRGAFDSVDAALIMHPSRQTHVCPRMLGMRSLRMEFRGTSAHGAQSPHEGRSALGAVIQTFGAVDTLRQHIRMDARIHGIITHGGEKPSVIPEYAACHFYVRAADDRYLDELMERVLNCARGAALATGTQVQVLDPEFPAYQPYLPNQVIAEHYTRNVEALGERVNQVDEHYVYASNDIGNVSRRLPVTAMMFGISRAASLADHSREFAEAAASPLGDRALLLAAKSQAMTVADMLAEPAIVAQAKAELTAAA